MNLPPSFRDSLHTATAPELAPVQLMLLRNRFADGAPHADPSEAGALKEGEVPLSDELELLQFVYRAAEHLRTPDSPVRYSEQWMRVREVLATGAVQRANKEGSAWTPVLDALASLSILDRGWRASLGIQITVPHEVLSMPPEVGRVQESAIMGVRSWAEQSPPPEAVMEFMDTYRWGELAMAVGEYHPNVTAEWLPMAEDSDPLLLGIIRNPSVANELDERIWDLILGHLDSLESSGIDYVRALFHGYLLAHPVLPENYLRPLLARLVPTPDTPAQDAAASDLRRRFVVHMLPRVLFLLSQNSQMDLDEIEGASPEVALVLARTRALETSVQGGIEGLISSQHCLGAMNQPPYPFHPESIKPLLDLLSGETYRLRPSFRRLAHEDPAAAARFLTYFSEFTAGLEPDDLHELFVSKNAHVREVAFHSLARMGDSDLHQSPRIPVSTTSALSISVRR